MNKNIHQQFIKPSDEFTPIPFWFWNDTLTNDEIIRQIRDFKEKGVMGFVIHPRMGLPKEIVYLSDLYLDFVETAVQEAANHGMIVMLYDEAMYPSGSAKGLVVQDHPEYGSRGLRMDEYLCEGNLEIAITLNHGETLVSAQAVERASKNNQCPCSTQIIVVHEDTLKFSPPTENKWSVLLFIETYSKGTIRGIHFGEDDGEKDAPPSADLLNPDAVAKFIHLTHERYYSRLEKYFGNTIQAFFTDEPEILGRGGSKGLIPWTDGFMEWYTQNGNGETDLPALFLDMGKRTEIVRKNYQKSIMKRLEYAFYKPISEWCQNHGIALTGHPAQSNDIGLLHHFQIPGQDLVWRWVAPENDLGVVGPHSTVAKCSADAARHRGRRRNLNEFLGVCGKERGWDLSPDDMKWYMDWLLVRGVNLLCPHAFYYSIDGRKRSHERPPDVGPNNLWWPYYQYFSQYMKRLSWLLTDSVNEAGIAVLCKNNYLPWKIVKPLYENQLEFNYLEEDLLTECVLDQGKVKIQNQSYNVLLIEQVETLEENTNQILEEWIASGGKVIIYDEHQQFRSIRNAIYAHTLDELVKYLENDRKLELKPASKDIRISYLIKDRCHFILVVNEGESSYNGMVLVGIMGKVEKWDPWNGTREEMEITLTSNKMLIPISLHRRESLVFYVNEREFPNKSLGEKMLEKLLLASITDQWNITRGSKQLDTMLLESWPNWPGFEYYSGTLVYQNIFIIDEDQLHFDQIILNLGAVFEIAHIWINNQDAGVKMWAPYVFDIKHFLTPGKNSIKIAVTNSQSNQMDHKPNLSGLLGPVIIEGYKLDNEAGGSIK
ncbi:MAG: glycosylhydrolase-like jelly roll fold domain-containing protein [Neobacillus sp.]